MSALKKRVFLFLFFFCNSFVAAYVDPSLEGQISSYSVSLVIIASLFVVFFAFLFLLYTKQLAHYKKLIFCLIVIPVGLSSLFLAGSTVYVNLISDTKGPVHWHADFEVWNCEEKLDLIDPRGLSNKVGSALFHEHNDNRVHVEGVVLNTAMVGIDDFFHVVGGDLKKNYFSFPTENEVVYVDDGNMCNGRPGKVQIFLYRIINPNKKSGFIYSQEKLEKFEDYTSSPYSLVPPGDCIIVEFSEEKDKTDHLCESYRVAKERGELIGR